VKSVTVPAMPLTFKTALVDASIDPKKVRLLRYQDSKVDYGRTPYEMFKNDRPSFELYQSHQSSERRAHLNAGYWASFVATPDKRTLFCELYASRYIGVGDRDVPQPHREGKTDQAGHYDLCRERIRMANSARIRTGVPSRRVKCCSFNAILTSEPSSRQGCIRNVTQQNNDFTN
jgi:hypothetical protein